MALRRNNILSKILDIHGISFTIAHGYEIYF